MKVMDFTHIASDGKAIFVHRWLPSGSAKAVALVAHGMAEHGGRYERFAGAMTQAGWAVYAPDHRGHGKTASDGRLGCLGEGEGFPRIRDDLHEIASVAAREHGTAPTFLLGHSMGSILAELYIAAYGQELAGCVLSGVVAPKARVLTSLGSSIAGLGIAFKGRDAPAKSLHALSFSANNKDFEPARSPVDWLSRDDAEVDKYVGDPLCGFVCSFGFYRHLMAALSMLYGKPGAFASVPKSLPVYILSGAEDPLGGAHGFVPLLSAKLKAAGLQSVESRLYPGARHEIMNETNRDEVQRDIKEWLEASLPKDRPGRP